jgi:phosphoribosylformimino-5-aminoimidazole carboxamide ribotide isomerase
MPAAFSIIPVLDLKAGHVVHARAGDRANYQPIRSSLTRSSEPAAVVDALLAAAPFRRFYVADLDAIAGTGEHRRLVAALAQRHRGVEFWIDCAVRTVTDALSLIAAGLTPICGSETLADVAELEEILWRIGAGGFVLSLDYRGDAFLGPAALAESAGLWPHRVIAMTLGRVGMGLGPDFARLAQLRGLAATRQVFAAGGVRGPEDLDELARMGVAGALVASSLHDGRLSRQILQSYEKG